MIRLSLRQFRSQSYVAIVLLGLVAIAFTMTGSHVAHIYNALAKAQAACAASPTCPNVTVRIDTVDALLELIGTVLVAVPALVGAFWGAPLISREFENGTYRLAWTQSVSRTRWVATKLAVVGAASVIATGLLSLMVTWWSSPIDRANMNRFADGIFGQRDITPLGYAAFAFALGVTLGVVIRRALPAMAATLGVFLAVRLAFTYLVRPYLVSPRHLTAPLSAVTQGFGSTNGGAPNLIFGTPSLPNAWIYSARGVDASGHALTAKVVNDVCPALARPPQEPAAGTSTREAAPGVPNSIHACVTKLSSMYHGVVTYQPASRYWLFQCYETAIYLVMALALAVLCFYWLHRHAA
jgi:hypothetical protein